MSQFRLSQRSLMRLVGVHPDLVEVVKLAIQRTAVDFMVVEGVRTLALQREYVTKGASQTMNSYHLPQADGFGHAVDLAPLVRRAIPWNDWLAFADLADVVKACAAELGVPVEWGGDWKSFKDGPHFQIPRDWQGRA
ncbi:MULTISPECIES: M15 family metallopeptidase [Achromobacter]|uniref:M15 family metallopeptidase n=1 Tax=Achromobacter spanius TaxID=217203 RepID=A0ABY8GV67_9BURK|nr:MULTISPECIES: M15 family metallopeptidase [Achromobacter]WAI82286.1 M15 family metallopeptidase [Achromobacter spanius]WEX92374.1 M15 family metallopeptidase [Achromobacter sp. SS2-2022]WFP08476.1 M15 family metallopeptidase [Achromobacter spanius]